MLNTDASPAPLLHHITFLYWFISTNVVFTSFKGDYSSTIWLWCVPHCPKNNLKHGIKILAVTSGTDSTVNVWLLNTTWCRENRLPSTPLHLLQPGIYAEIQIFFGTVCILVSGMVYRNVFCQSVVSPSRSPSVCGSVSLLFYLHALFALIALCSPCVFYLFAAVNI